ncbi:conserved hypothetical protein [Calothrix sp. PCC 7716]|nr:conserved hypothetical protein [Calothrix sp. PCC 7716]
MFIKTILILAANPIATSRLRLDEEVREIHNGLQRAKKRDQFRLEQRWAVREKDLYRAILDLSPRIVHFSGHSTQEDGIVLEDENGQPAFMGTEALSRTFKLFAEKGVECVLLNSCYSELQASEISHHVKYVIGMSRKIGDKAAINFAVAFYDALGAGEDIEFAFRLGCSQLIGLKEDETPILKINPTINQQEPSSTTPQPPIEDNFCYDAYISYSDKEPDATWVWNTLLPRLESAGLRIAVSGDVEVPGVTRVENIESAINQSKRTIIVLSEAYLIDNMASFENVLGQTMGIQEGTYRLLPLKLAPIEENKLPTRISMLTILNLAHPVRAEREFNRLVQALQRPLPQR